MHESSIAKQILDVALDRAAGAGARRVRKVRGVIAETESLSPGSIAFHFEAHARGTAAEGAALELDLTHVAARCSGCGETYAPEHHLLLCPSCGGTEAEVLGTPGLRVEAIEVE
jgi:hydrogenase nickel incorporation protein HypA/HybF